MPRPHGCLLCLYPETCVFSRLVLLRAWGHAVVWLCERGEETLSNDFHPVPSAPTLLETAGTPKYWATEPVGVLSRLSRSLPFLTLGLRFSLSSTSQRLLILLCSSPTTSYRLCVLLCGAGSSCCHILGFPEGAGGSPCVQSAREN